MKTPLISLFRPTPAARKAAFLVLAWCASHGAACAVTGTWNVDAATPWSTAANWLNGVIPDGVGDTANFTFNLTANRSIQLGANRTVGNLVIGDSTATYFGYSLLGSSPAFTRLIFDQTGTADATLTVPNVGGSVSNVFSSTIQLNDNLVVDTGFGSSASPQVTISGTVTDEAGAFSITKTGPGIMQLSGANAFDGGVRVAAGRITCNTNISTLGTAPVTVEAGGQVFLSTTSCLPNFTLTGSGYSNLADSGAQAGALRLGNTKGAMGNVAITPEGAGVGVVGTDSGFIMGSLSGIGDLQLNGTGTTTGSITLHGSAAGFTGTLFLSRGGFRFNGPFGGSIDIASVGTGAALGLGTSVAGNVVLDSISTQAVVRNLNGTLAIGGTLQCFDNTAVLPATFPEPGTSTLTLMTYTSKTGDGTLVFDPTGYRGSPTLQVGPTAAVITGLDVQTRTWTGLATGTWSLAEEANWTGGDGFFKQGDTVVFPSAGAGTVTLSGVVTPAAVTFTNTGSSDYEIAGTGTIDGAAGGITKDGDAWVTLGGVNTFSGPVQINAGRLILSNPRALGFTSGVTVAAGGTLDLNGQLLIGQSRQFDVSIAGTGDTGEGALINSGATIQFQGSPRSGARNVTLTADAAVGCGSGKAFDIGGDGVVDGKGHTLTKVGAGQVNLLGAAKNVTMVIESGALFGFGPDPFGTDLTIRGGATATAASQGVYSSNVTIESGGTLQHSTGTVSQWTGNFSATGDVTLNNANTSNTSLEIHSSFAIPGNLSRTGTGLIVFLGDVAVGGSVTINSGPLHLGNGGNSGSLGSTADINMSGTLPSLTVNRANQLTMPNLITGPGSLTKAGAGTLTLGAANSYSGTTTVSAGTLIANGTHSGTGAVTVASGATLGGGGGLPGAVTIQAGATLAPGTSAGTFTVGSATLHGTLRAEFGSAGTDLLHCTGALTLGATATLLLEPLGPAPTAKVIPLARYSTLTGTFANVSGLPEGYELVYAKTIGDELFIALVSTVTEDPYLVWIGGFYPTETNPAIIGPEADPDHDGLRNILENYLGTSPAAASQGLVEVSGSSGSVRFQHSRADAPLAGYAPSYEWSTDLATWTPSGAAAGGTTVTLVPTVVVDSPSPQNDRIEVVATVTGTDAANLFVRLRLTVQ